MNAIEGIDLAKETNRAHEQVMEERQARVRSVVSGIIHDVSKWKLERVSKKKELDSLDDKINKAEEKFVKLREGDWSVLNDNMFNNPPSSEKKESGEKINFNK